MSRGVELRTAFLLRVGRVGVRAGHASAKCARVSWSPV